MSRALDDLNTEFKPLAIELIARCVERNIDIRIIDTLRTEEEHRANLAAGTSWTARSKHLDGLAIDIAPKVVLTLKNWAPGHPHWIILGQIGESLGLRWGGRWERADMGHFEMTEG